MNNNQKDFDVKKIEVESAPVEVSTDKKAAKSKETDFKVKKPKKSFRFKKRYLGIGLGIIIVIILIFVGINLFKNWSSFSFSKDNVNLRITAPGEISSGEEIELSIYYQNNNRLALENVRLVINYPQDAYSLEGDELTQEIIELGQVLPKTEGVKDFKIRLAGEKGNIRTLAARLNYQPENLTSRFENSASVKINITSVLIGAYLNVPQKAISGEEVSYSLDYINNSDQDFSDLKIELNYPLDFRFKMAEPPPSEGNNIWQLERLEQGERDTIKISGILEGAEGEDKTLKASIGKVENGRILKYSQTSSVTQISASPLLVFPYLNNKEEEININAGEKLNYKIEFKNNTDIALSQLALKAYLEGEMFNLKTLKLKERGFFDSLNNVITWSAAGIESLALLLPNESGKVEFSLSLKESFSIKDFDDKNFQISIRVELETFNVPLQFNLEKLKIEKVLSSKINSQVILQARGYYNETTSTIGNYGPIPPRANQITTYTIHWQITNTSNDLEDVEIIAVLPEGINWQNVYSVPEDTNLEYNGRTKEIIWKTDGIPPGTGFLMPVYEVVFQIALRPSITQLGMIPVLIDESSLEATDVFTNEILESFSPAISAGLPDDPTIERKDGQVVE